MQVSYPEKPWYASKTILGAIAVLVALVIRWIVPDADLQDDQVLNVLTLVAQAVGAVVSVFGRVVAREAIAPLRRWRRPE